MTETIEQRQAYLESRRCCPPMTVDIHAVFRLDHVRVHLTWIRNPFFLSESGHGADFTDLRLWQLKEHMGVFTCGWRVL